MPGIPVVSNGSIKVASGRVLGSLSRGNEDHRIWPGHLVTGSSGPKL